MNVKKRFFILPLFFIVVLVLLISSYIEVKKRVIADFNTLQMVLASQASNAIEGFFEQLSMDQRLLTNDIRVANWQVEGESVLANFQKLNSRYIMAVTRVDDTGHIIYTFPERPDVHGKDISYQKHVKKILSTHQMVLSDVFEAVQGYQAIAFHAPIFNDGQYTGSLAMLISFDRLAENYMKNIRIGENGYAWVLSREGKELFCHNEEHVGKNIQEIAADFQGILAMADQMMEGEKGTCTYSSEKIHKEEPTSTLKHAVFHPIDLIDTRWSIVVATPEKDVLAPMRGIGMRWFLLFLILTTGMLLYIFLTIRALKIINNEEKNRAKAKILAENEKNIRNFVANSPSPIAFNDPDNQFLMLNHVFTFITGYQEEDISNLKEWFGQFLLTEEARKDAFSLLENTLTGRADLEVQPKEVIITCKNGEKKTFEYRYSRIGSRHILTLNDLTYKIETDIQKKRLEDQLSRAKKMEALGFLAGGVAHDLNNILSGIVTYPELILMKLEENSPLRKPVNSIMESGKRAAAVVQDLLTLARGVAYKVKVFNLNMLIEACKQDLEELVSRNLKSKIDITWNLDPRTPHLQGSDYHLRKVLNNLVLNAVEAISETLDIESQGERKGHISIACRPDTLEIDFEGYETVPKGAYCLIEIQDNGPGIEHADLDRIFEPFFTKKVLGRSGSGLGLMVVWNTVKEFSGYIDIKSSPMGTTFTLYLPVSSGVEDMSSPHESSEIIKGSSEKILIIDDHAGQCEIAMELLVQLGFSPTSVSSGEKAIEMLKEQDFELILLDMILEHGINGDEVFRQIHDFKPHQKAIIVSGYSKTRQVKETLDLGAKTFLRKPYSVQELSDAIRSVLELGR